MQCFFPEQSAVIPKLVQYTARQVSESTQSNPGCRVRAAARNSPSTAHRDSTNHQPPPCLHPLPPFSSPRRLQVSFKNPLATFRLTGSTSQACPSCGSALNKRPADKITHAARVWRPCAWSPFMSPDFAVPPSLRRPPWVLNTVTNHFSNLASFQGAAIRHVCLGP
jgi:hypothetical protein